MVIYRYIVNFLSSGPDCSLLQQNRPIRDVTTELRILKSANNIIETLFIMSYKDCCIEIIFLAIRKFDIYALPPPQVHRYLSASSVGLVIFNF